MSGWVDPPVGYPLTYMPGSIDAHYAPSYGPPPLRIGAGTVPWELAPVMRWSRSRQIGTRA
jgi:hypothetical protein